MARVFAVAICIAAGLVAVKDHGVLRRAGLTGRCTAVAAPPGQAGDWRACRPGRLAGRPDLSRNACTAVAIQGRVEYWRCPAPLRSGPLG